MGYRTENSSPPRSETPIAGDGWREKRVACPPPPATNYQPSEEKTSVWSVMGVHQLWWMDPPTGTLPWVYGRHTSDLRDTEVSLGNYR